MKFLFKTLTLALLFSTSLFAREIILVENAASPEEGRLLIKILEEKFNMPRNFIFYKRIDGACRKNSEAIMQLCLKKNGELDIVKLDKFVMQNSIGSFLERDE